MDYKNKLLSLIKEANLVPQYKRLPRFFRFLLVISMLPVICFDFCLIIDYFILAFIHKGLSTPFDILYDFVHKERKDANDLTNAAICLVTMPGLFIFKALLAIFSFVFYIQWFAIMCATYIATLGGIRWQPYILEATFDVDLNNFEPTSTVKGVKTFTIITFLSGLLAIVTTPICGVLDTLGATLSATGIGAIIGIPLLILSLPISLIGMIAYVVYPFMTFIINPLIFRLKPVNNDAE